MLLYVVTICAAVIFCALSAPLYALPHSRRGRCRAGSLPALTAYACPLSGGGLGRCALHPCTDYRQHGGALSRALYALPRSGRVRCRAGSLPALSGHACPLYGGGLPTCRRPRPALWR